MNRTSRIIAAAAAAGALVLGGVGVTYAVTGTAESADSPAGVAVASLPPSEAGDGAPAWLPDGARPEQVSVEKDGSGAVTYSYALDGAVNQASRATRPETYVTVAHSPAVTEMPPLMANPRTFDIGTADVNGVEATTSVPKDGYGAHRVEWVDDTGYHVVLCSRLRTDEGKSGVGLDVLLEIARSI